MITESPKFQKEVKDIVDNRVVSWSLLRWLNEQETKIRSYFIGLIIVNVLGKESRFLYSILFLLFRKEYLAILDTTKKITKEAILNLVDKIKQYKAKHQRA